MDIHEDNVIGARRQSGQRLHAISRRVHGVAKSSQQGGREHHIDAVVFGDQHPELSVGNVRGKERAGDAFVNLRSFSSVENGKNPTHQGKLAYGLDQVAIETRRLKRRE